MPSIPSPAITKQLAAGAEQATIFSPTNPETTSSDFKGPTHDFKLRTASLSLQTFPLKTVEARGPKPRKENHLTGVTNNISEPGAETDFM